MLSRYAVTLSLLAVAAVACGDSNSPTVDAQVSALDQCDPASFNAALGNGACTKQGNVTLTAFNNELNSTHHVASWQFVPNNFTIRVGQAITVTNNGGEKHTFTEVDNFGGGIVPALNSASGNPSLRMPLAVSAIFKARSAGCAGAGVTWSTRPPSQARAAAGVSTCSRR